MARYSLTPFGGRSLFGGDLDPVMSLHREMNRLFDEVVRGPSLPAGGSGQGQAGVLAGSFVNAHMNVSETEAEFRITVELAGVTEQDIDLSLENEVLTIRGEKRFEQTKGGEKENFHFVERSYGTFQRSLRLPFAVNPDQVQARFENGVLTITLPKTAQQERSRRIQVQGGSKTIEQSGEGGGDQSSQSGTSGGQGTSGS